MRLSQETAKKLGLIFGIILILALFVFIQRRQLNESPFSREFLFQYPFLAASDSKKNFYLLDNGVKRLTKLDPQGRVLFTLDGGQRGKGKFYQAWKMVVDEYDRVYILNGVRSIQDGLTDMEQIIRYKPDGTLDAVIWQVVYNEKERQSLYDNIGGESVLSLSLSGGSLYFFRAEGAEQISLFQISLNRGKTQPEKILTLPVGGGDIVDITGTSAENVSFSKRDGKIYRLKKGKLEALSFAKKDSKVIRKPWSLAINPGGTLYFLDLFQQSVLTLKQGQQTADEFFSRKHALEDKSINDLMFRSFTLSSRGGIAAINEKSKNLIYINHEGKIEISLEQGLYPYSAILLRWVVWLALLGILISLGSFVFVAYREVFQKKISILLKQLAFLIPVIFAGIYYTSNRVYEQVYAKYETQLSQTLVAMAQMGAPRISGDTLEKITKPEHFMNSDYQKIRKEIFDNLNQRKNPWNQSLYTIIYKVMDKTFYVAANTSGYYGVLYPWAVPQPAHLAAYEKGEAEYSQYTDSEGRWLIGTAPIRNSKGAIVGVYELGTDMYVAAEIRELFVQDLTRGLVISVGIFTLIFVILAYMLLVYIRILRNSVDQVTGGEWGITINIKSRDEIGDLGKGFNLMSQQIKNYILEITALSQAYFRFVPQEFLKFLDKRTIMDVQLGDQIQREMSVLFSDIRSFTSISEKMTPEENFNFINEYMGVMGPVIRAHEGFIDKYIGDAIMALFPETPDDAVTAAVGMHHALHELNQRRIGKNQDAIHIGIGIHYGKLMLGIVGEQERREGTVISDAVNLSSRLEGLTKMYGAGIIISDHTLQNLKNHYHYRILDRVKVKGKSRPVEIFEIMDGLSEEDLQKKLATKESFEKALALYFEGHFDQALDLFDQIKDQNPLDKATALYVERCMMFLTEGAPADWDGVMTLKTK